MSELPYNFTLLTRYWLDDLPSAEQDQLEEDYFADNDLFIELLNAKDQLISHYLSGQLSPGDHERFERHFLTRPGCQCEVELAAFLQPSLMRRSLTRQPALSGRISDWLQAIPNALRARQLLAGLAAAAILIVAVASLWLGRHFSSEKSKTDLGQTPTPTAPAGPATVYLTLKPGLVRFSGETPKAIVGPETQMIELRLEAGTKSYPNYRASLQKLDSGNVEVLTDSSLKAEIGADGRRTVVWKAPAAGLFGDYQVKLSGVGADNSINSIGAYYFKARNR